MRQMLYKFFDSGSDPASLVPGVDVGSVHFYLWRDLNPAQGVYHWEDVDANLEAEARWRLSDGSVKPVILMVLPYISSKAGWNYGFYDATPAWVYQQGGFGESYGGMLVGHVVTDKAGNKAAVPAYDQQFWRAQWCAFLKVFGYRYGDHPQIAYVVASTGLDSETQPTKGSWLDAIRGTAIEAGFGKLVPLVIDTCAGACPVGAAFLNCAPGGNAREPWAEQAFRMGLGIKHSGAQPDQDSHQGYGTYVGSWDMFAEANAVGSPVAVETAHWFGEEETYWTLPAMLHYRPEFVDLHASIFNSAKPEWLRWLASYVGVTPATSPGVWTVLRDMEYPLQTWGTGKADGCSGKAGDWQFGLVRQDEAERVMRTAMPADPGHIYARQCRRVAAGKRCRFLVDAEYALRYRYFSVAVDLLDHTEQTVLIEGAEGTGVEQSLSGSDVWRQISAGYLRLDSVRPEVTISSAGGPLYLHKVELRGMDEEDVSPSISASPSAPPEDDLEARVAALEARVAALDEEVDGLSAEDARLWAALQAAVIDLQGHERRIAALEEMLRGGAWYTTTTAYLGKETR